MLAFAWGLTAGAGVVAGTGAIGDAGAGTPRVLAVEAADTCAGEACGSVAAARVDVVASPPDDVAGATAWARRTGGAADGATKGAVSLWSHAPDSSA